MTTTLLLLAAYLLGAIPFGLLIARARGVDIRAHGSGNIGATNVFRVVGKPWGLLCLFLDFAKGFAAAQWIPGAVTALLGTTEPTHAGLLAGAAAIAGHNWPVYLKFKGGKGIATSGGVLSSVAPAAVLAAPIVWLLTFLLTRFVSLASIMAACAVMVAGWYHYGTDPLLAGVLTALGLMAVIRHRSNVQRLLAGQEHRFKR